MNAALMTITRNRSERGRRAASARAGRTPPHASPQRRLATGFTLTEMLFVVALIGLLIALLLVSMSKVRYSARRAATEALLSSIGTSIEQYHADLNDYPPLVTGIDDYGEMGRSAIETPRVLGEVAALANPGSSRDAKSTAINDASENARFYSEFTLGVYLLGNGDINGDNDAQQGWWTDENSDGLVNKDDNVYDDGRFGAGFRNPGELGAWKKIVNAQVVHDPQRTGNTFGPYLEPTAKFLERVPVTMESDRLVVDRGQPMDNTAQVLYRFVDSWGNPIRYYKDWKYRNDDRKVTADSMGFAPIELRTYEDMNFQYEGGEKRIDTVVSGAPYALLAAGAEPLLRLPPTGAGEVGDVVSPFGDRYINHQTGEPAFFQNSFDNPYDFDAESEKDRLLDYLKTNVRYAP